MFRNGPLTPVEGPRAPCFPFYGLIDPPKEGTPLQHFTQLYLPVFSPESVYHRELKVTFRGAILLDPLPGVDFSMMSLLSPTVCPHIPPKPLSLAVALRWQVARDVARTDLPPLLSSEFYLASGIFTLRETLFWVLWAFSLPPSQFYLLNEIPKWKTLESATQVPPLFLVSLE